MPLKICVVSGGRADFGFLLEPMKRLRADGAFALSLVMTGQHLNGGRLDPETAAAVEEFAPLLVDMRLDADDAVAISHASGRVLAGSADAFAHLRPDLVMLLGDRYEILCVALAATLARIPIAHIAGGDVTHGAIDDSFRHALTAMAHIHFVTTEEAGRRVRQLGASPDHVHVVGSPALDLALSNPAMTRETFFDAVGLPPRKRNILVTFHPETRAADSIAQARDLCATLDDLGSEVGILLTGSNADPEGASISGVMEEFAKAHGNAKFVQSLGFNLYVNALRHMDAMVGNSSSGLYEAPSFALPAVNIGGRQDGRARAPTVIDCAPVRAEILKAIDAAFARGRTPVVNPYGDGEASARIVAALKKISDPRALLAKRFVDAVA